MATLAPLFLIGSSSFLQVTRTCIKMGGGGEFRPGPTTLYGVNYPWTSEYFMFST